MAEQTKIEALREVIWEAKQTRTSLTALKRVRKAAKTLGLTDQEIRELESTLEYRPSPDEELYLKFQ